MDVIRQWDLFQLGEIELGSFEVDDMELEVIDVHINGHLMLLN